MLIAKKRRLPTAMLTTCINTNTVSLLLSKSLKIYTNDMFKRMTKNNMAWLSIGYV